jgi:hypothetical protein
MVKKFVRKWVAVLKPLSGSLVGLLVLATLLIPPYGTLARLSSALEQPDFLGIAYASDLLDKVSFLPEKALQFGLLKANISDMIHLWMVSALFGGVAAITLYCLLRLWQTKRIALLGSILFVGSSWFLHQSRQAVPDALYLLALPLLLLSGTWLQDKKYDRLLPLSMVMVAFCLYLPGLWLFVLIGAIVLRSSLFEAWTQISRKLRALVAMLFVLPLVPLGYCLVSRPDQIMYWLGLPSRDLLTTSNIVNNLYELPKQLFVRGPNEPVHWLVGTPVLDVFTTAMVVLGAYSYLKGDHPVRARVLAGFTIFGLAFVVAGGPVSISLLIPLVYLVAANGVALLLQQWFTVFPRNPFARFIGLAFVVVAIGVTVFYHTTRYYVAWPHAAATQKAYSTENP